MKTFDSASKADGAQRRGNRIDHRSSLATRCDSDRGAQVDDAPVAGDDALGRDLGERHEHEGALVQARMRQRQLVARRGTTSP